MKLEMGRGVHHLSFDLRLGETTECTMMLCTILTGPTMNSYDCDGRPFTVSPVCFATAMHGCGGMTCIWAVLRKDTNLHLLYPFFSFRGRCYKGFGGGTMAKSSDELALGAACSLGPAMG
jgi:hypothetical protein